MFLFTLISYSFAEEPLDTNSPVEESVLQSKSRLPSVVYRAPVDYPQQELLAGIGGFLMLEVYISDQGTVIDAEVLESLNPSFDEAALDSIQNFLFTPALDEAGKEAASLIQYRFVFEPQEVPTLVLEGTVYEAGVKRLLSGIEVVAVGPEAKRATSRTDENGIFRFRGLDAGEWTVMASKPSFGFKTREVSIQKGKVSQLRFYLVRDKAQAALQADAEIVVEERLASSELTERFLTAKEIAYLPGSGGDVVKAVQNLPGIARAPLGVGQLIIRGTAPEDSTFYIDGGNIPNVFHFAGLTTVLNSDIIEEVAFLPGNYSVRYGRQLGGLVDIRTRPGLPERSRGYVSVDIYQSTIFAEQKIGDAWALSVSGRRSYADFILNPILNSSSISIRAPRYYDLQTRVIYKPSEGEFVDFLFFLSDDRFQFLGQDVEGNEQLGLSFGTSFQKFRFRWNKLLSNGWKQETVFVAGPELEDFAQGAEGEAYELRQGVNLRHEYHLPVTPDRSIGLRFGLDLYTGIDSFKYDIPSFPYPSEEGSFFFLSPGVYGELTAEFDPLTLITGIRTEGYTLGGTICVPAFDPRFAFRYRAGDTTKIKGGVGAFSQFPLPRELDVESDGVADLNAEYSVQYSLGVEQKVFDAFQVDMVLFYNALDQLVVGREDRFEFFTGPPLIGPKDTEDYANLGTGQIYGLESQIRYNGPNTTALIAATFSRSERINRDGDLRLFEYDQPFVLNALISQQLPKNWRLGGRIRYGAGNPYTPIKNSIFDLNRRAFIPVYAEYDSGRLPRIFFL